MCLNFSGFECSDQHAGSWGILCLNGLEGTYLGAHLGQKYMCQQTKYITQINMK